MYNVLIRNVSVGYVWKDAGTFLETNQMSVQEDVRKSIVCHRVISKWNILDDDTVTAKTVSGFKSKLEIEGAKTIGL